MRTALRAIGEIGVAAGLVVLLFYAYLLWGTGSYTERTQRVLQRGLTRELGWRHTDGPGRIRLGHALALLRIPRLGASYRYAIVEGVGSAELRKGPGHYPGTALPGQIGNFVISGHRTTYGAPFNRIDELRRGDAIVVEASDARYTYQVVRTEIVRPDDLDVTDPVPGRPAQRPTLALMTMTTCHPKFSAGQRLVVQSELVRREERHD
ncbi:class E sortase [Microbispora corallina]|uniref:Class E sortase n=1 Tax=Microbispora corallina TaxID=83302 RepID=A0ABQ4G4V4_9ACTN|nr:class E sortase [Microbispora corallina]GIH42103.1 class E sortase [Microbispora corallina]